MNRLEVLTDIRCTLGECPRWDKASKTLYWLDVVEQVLYQLDPSMPKLQAFQMPERISAFAFHQSGALVLVAQSRILIANADLTRFQTLTSIDLPADTRFNDAVVDPHGRLWVGTLNSEHRPENYLYCINVDGTVDRRDGGIRAANGIGWSPAGETMYFADTRAAVIYAYDFDSAAGALTNRRVFVTFDAEHGVPDGLMVDTDGGIWCALWNGWRVERYLPNGTRDLQIELPVARPTACTFGGEDLRTLYITSARHGLPAEELALQSLAGAVFTLSSDSEGLPANIAAHVPPAPAE